MWLCLNGGCGTVNPESAIACQVCKVSGIQLRLFKPGTLIGNYEIRHFVGHGGFGVVYEATYREGDEVRDVALKQTLLTDHQTFERELNLLEKTSHPNLPRYYEAFQHNGSGYLAMEFVHGLNLKELLTHAGGALGQKQVIQYAIELCSAVSALHTHKPPLLHRDIKPANIRLTPQGQIKLVDFGLAKVSTDATRTTQQGATLGYASWEQLTGIAKTDERSDIYSVGATLYHLLTNVFPASGFERGLEGTDPLISPEQINPTLHRDVAKIVLKAMARKPAARYQSVLELKYALQRVEKVLAEPQPTTKFLALPINLSLVLATLAGLLVVLAIGVNYLPATSAVTITPTANPIVVDAQPTPSVEVINTPSATQPISPTATELLVVSTETPLPPTSLPLEPQFAALSVQPIANSVSDFADPLQGIVELSDIPFDVSTAIFKSQASVEPFLLAPTEARITADIVGATRLHLLLNTGNGKVIYEGEIIGTIAVVCDGSELSVGDLILGETIREWHSDEGVVGSAALPSQVYEGGRTDNDTQRGHIDLLSFELPLACRSNLTEIIVRDTSSETVSSLDPALNWTGVTVEYVLEN